MSKSLVATLITSAMLISIGLASVASARETTAPEGCYLKINRNGTFVCCPEGDFMVCRQQPSKLPKATTNMMLEQ